MPIRPENKARYPKEWPQISRRIRFERAEHRCEKCGAENYKPHPVTGSKVILTVAHLDHQPENCSDDNLMAMCQRCHLRYDQHHHRACERTADLFDLKTVLTIAALPAMRAMRALRAIPAMRASDPRDARDPRDAPFRGETMSTADHGT